jgi:hypothetical protein
MEPGCLKHFTGPARSGSWMQSNSVSRLRPRDGNGIQLDQHGHLGLAVMEIWTCKVSTSSDSWFVFRYGSFHRCSYGGLGSLLGQLRSRNNAELCNWMPTTKTVPQREWTLTYATMPYQLKFSSTTWEIQNCIGGHVTRSICIYIYVLGKEFSNLCDPTILTSCYICCTCINLLTIQGVRMTQAISPKIKRMHWIWPCIFCGMSLWRNLTHGAFIGEGPTPASSPRDLALLWSMMGCHGLPTAWDVIRWSQSISDSTTRGELSENMFIMFHLSSSSFFINFPFLWECEGALVSRSILPAWEGDTGLLLLVWGFMLRWAHQPSKK